MDIITNRNRRRLMRSLRSSLRGSGDALGSALSKGVRSIELTSRSAYTTPLATLGSFVLGCVVGVLGVIYIPQLRSRGVFDNIGEKIDEAKESLQSGFSKVKEGRSSSRVS